MYVNLLETAMDKETAANAHPAFVEVVRQMVPDEAKIVQFFGRQRTVAARDNKSLLEKVAKPAGCERPEKFPSTSTTFFA